MGRRPVHASPTGWTSRVARFLAAAGGARASSTKSDGIRMVVPLRSKHRSRPTFLSVREDDRSQTSANRRPPELTATELRVLAALEDLSSELGYAPTFAQILSCIGWSPKSKGSLHIYIERLRAHGVVAGSGRSLRIVR